MTILLVGALGGCATHGGGGTRKPDSGTLIAPAVYRHQLNVWCKPQAKRAQNLTVAVERAAARLKRTQIAAAFSAFFRWNIAFDAHFEQTPLPAGMQARMRPVLSLMAETDPTLQSMLAAFRSRDDGDLVAGFHATRKLYDKTRIALRRAGLTGCE
jgi:hypothetical protein